MKLLWKAELLKLSKSTGYWILLMVSLGIGITFGVMFGISSSEFRMDGYRLFMASITTPGTMIPGHMVLFSFYAAIFICNEYKNRTFGMGLLSGVMRKELFVGKAMVFLIGLLPIVFLMAISGTIVTTLLNDFGEAFFTALPSMISVTCYSILRSFLLGSFCLLLAVVARNVGGIISLGLGMATLLPMLAMFLPLQSLLAHSAIKYTFIYQIAKLNPPSMPESPLLFYAVMLLYTMIFLLAGWHVFKKTELN